MNFSQLRAFVAVAHHSNFSEAALELNLSQSAISYAISTLEEELGVPLFVRGRHGAVLTAAGEHLVHHAQQALQQIEIMHKEANLYRGLQGGRVRIASFRSVATHVLPKVIAQFRARFPEVTVTLIERPHQLDIEQTLREGRADIGFTYLPTSDEFEVWEILRDEYVALLPPTTKVTSSLTWQNLAAHSLVWLPCLPCGGLLHKHLISKAPPMNTVVTIQEDSTIVSMVAQGLGAAILGRLAAAPIPKEVGVYSLPVPISRVIGVAVLSDALHVPAVFAFLDMLKQFELQSPAADLCTMEQHFA